MRYLLILSILAHYGCTPKLAYLSAPSRDRMALLAEVIHFDQDNLYYLSRPERFANLPNLAFFDLLNQQMDCGAARDTLKVRDVEKLFGVKLPYSPQGRKFKHSGKGFMLYTPKEIQENRKRQWTPDIFFMFTKDGKYIQLIAFSCDLHG
jgi:hypothetical protein